MRSLGCLLVVALTSQLGLANDWKQFRGPDAGRLSQVLHPQEWSATSNVSWSVPMSGSGWSSPVVVGDRIFLTAARSENGDRPKGMMAGVASMGTYRNGKPVKHRFTVTCLSLKDGKEIWTKTVGEHVPPVVHPSNTYATESPATDGERVFSFFATTGTLVAWDLDGRELWRQELGTYKTGNAFGTGSSLAVSQGKVFVQFDNDEKSFVVAFNTSDGKQVWRDDRASKTSWSTPLIWNNGTRDELVACGSGVVTSYDPTSGNVLWRLNGIQSSFSASPAMDGERIYFGNSGPMSAGPLVAVKAGSQGEMTLDRDFKSKDVAWSRTRSGPGMASPVVTQNRIYIPGSGGILNCYDADTGERVYRTRVPKMGTVAASLWADDDHVFILDENGSTFVLATGPEFDLIRTNKIDDLFWSTPAVAGPALLLRGVEKLYCIRGGEDAKR